MKSAEELFNRIFNIDGKQISEPEAMMPVTSTEFKLALAEHDAEIKKLIDDMIEKCNQNVIKYSELMVADINRIKVEALTELKEKLK